MIKKVLVNCTRGLNKFGKPITNGKTYDLNLREIKDLIGDRDVTAVYELDHNGENPIELTYHNYELENHTVVEVEAVKTTPVVEPVKPEPVLVEEEVEEEPALVEEDDLPIESEDALDEDDEE